VVDENCSDWFAMRYRDENAAEGGSP